MATVLLTVFSFFYAIVGTLHWYDARQQRRRALAELRTARRLRLHAEQAWQRYTTMSHESIRLHASLADAWTKMYGTPFPVKAPSVEKTN